MTWEIAVVKTTDYGTRLKVGGGTSAYKSLDFVGNATNHLCMLRGGHPRGADGMLGV